MGQFIGYSGMTAWCRYKKLRMSSLLLLILLVSACIRPRVYSEYRTITPEGWGMSDELFYSFYVTDTTTTYTITASLRYSPEFELKTLPIGIVYEDPHRHFDVKTVMWSLEAPDKLMAQTGYNIFQTAYTIDEARKFPTSGLYTISLRHLSQDTLLVGVVEMGLIVDFSENKRGD